MNTQPNTEIEAIERARYKLRQAEIVISHLREVPHEIAADMRRAQQPSIPDLRLDTFFFSCLGLSKSAYNIINDDQGGRYKDAIYGWRMNVLDQTGREQFNRMMRLREKDVHQGRSECQTLACMIPIRRSVDDDGRMYQSRPNYAILGIERPITRHTNPDGSTVGSYNGLQSSMQLYVDIASVTCEVSNACERFVAQLRQLIDALEAAKVPPIGPIQRFGRLLKKKLRIRH